jgi:acetyl-CoA synthase
VKGYFTGVTEYARMASHGTVNEVSMYSIMENPMTACFVAPTEVLIGDRPVPIGAYVDGHINEGFHYDAALTIDANGKTKYERIVGMHKNPAPDRLFQIVTKSGNELLLTANHRIAIDHPDGLEWVRADQVSPGDRIYSLRHLKLAGRIPGALDILPDDCRIADESLLAEIAQELERQYGSVKQGFKHAGLTSPHPRVRSLPLGDLKRLVNLLGRDWEQIKQRIGEVRFGNTTLQLPEMSADLFYLLGLLASDGSFSRRGHYACFVNFVNADEGLLQAFTEAYQRVFPDRKLGLRLKKDTSSSIGEREVRSTRPCYSLYAANPFLGLVSQHLGIKMDGEERWDLGRMLALPEAHIAAFIAGEFDGDGSVRLRRYEGKYDYGEAYLCIDDERAARHLQLLLKRLGIVGYVHKSGPVYKIELHGSNLRRFAEIVPSRHPEKSRVLKGIAALPSDALDKTQEQVLPYATGKALATLPAAQDVLSPSTRYYYETARSRPVRGSLERVIKAHPEAATTLAPLLDNDYFLDPIITVEEIENHEYDHVYNLTMLDVHSYLAGSGALVKNCGCFECIVMVIPEANGVMVVSREDPSMTPAGMTFSTLAGMAGGGLQSPGIMGIGKYYLTSPKFISADGGFKRVVWMSSFLKQTMVEELKAVCEREGDPDLLDKIADETICTDVEGLLPFLEEKGHPALTMPPMF